MNYCRIILDGLAMAAVFNLFVALLWIAIPVAFASMLPNEIKKASPIRDKREVNFLRVALLSLYAGVFSWMIISAYQAQITGFWNMFWTAYIEMFFVNLGDLIGLDWIFKDRFKDKIMIPGTEQCKAWNNSEWMRTLGLPEHLLAWPFIVCPLVGLLCAGIGTLMR